MFRVLGVTLLLVSSLLAAPQFMDDHVLEETEVADGAIAWSEEEATTQHLDLEDPTSWTASTEILDENHAWYRRRRSTDAAEEEAKDDLAVAESVVFQPSHLRNRRKLAREDCRRRYLEFATWRKQTNHHGQTRNHCNSYCCYPVANQV